MHIGVEHDPGCWRFAVRDNGIGVDPRFAGKLFGFFKRIERDRSPGTGMGLAICKKIVVRHGGRVWVESQPGKGSTFYFTIVERAHAQSATKHEG
ncbi:MAG TPA: ATP-binding protein [Methylomirabilota bacterium]|nr:ATP-binding protein [Methylomirabilota bacterium]